ncbi:MAG: hypothetical protein IPN66_16875 [Candidatus Competibacteraceae bacterium]|nr:hypothetical protein [Candidatus Competibacteraceae bacterium]
MYKLPDGITDDMNISLPSGLTIEMIVDLVLSAGIAHTPDDDTERKLVQLGLSEDDAALARDRSYGGIVRAALNNPANCPSREKDPIAWASYQRASQDPTIFPKVYPEMHARMLQIKITPRRQAQIGNGGGIFGGDTSQRMRWPVT